MSAAPHLASNGSDSAKVEERRALSAKEVHDALLLEGEGEVARAWTALGWSALASGLSMGLSLLLEGVLRAHLPATQWGPLISKLGYSAGFIAVTLGRQQLYTETTLTAMLPLLHERTWSMLVRVVRLWLVILIANLIGAWLFAWAASHEVSFGGELRAAFRQIGHDAARHGALDAFVRGIFGGWLIALMVWLMPSANSARLWVIVLITYTLSAAGLTHIIAGSIETFYLIAVGELTTIEYTIRFGVPVLVGNSIGGMVFVALLNHAQVATDSKP